MQFTTVTSRAKLIEFHPLRIITPVLHGGVIALTAFRARHGDNDAVSLFLCHGCLAGRERLSPIRCFYWMMPVITPEPTVRPPSRMANLSPSSIATGVINSILISTLSPGITISVPSGRCAEPVTSVVRM